MNSAPEPTPRVIVGVERAGDDRRTRLETELSRGSAGTTPTRFTFATGVDAGTLNRPTLTLGGTIARSLGSVELAATARYGLPVVDEVVETSFSESQRHDFGALELRACRGVGHEVRVSACAGTEVGAVHATRALQSTDGTTIDVARFSPRLSGTLTALVAHRGGLIEPGLELGGAAVALGREARLVVRVAAGASIPF